MVATVPVVRRTLAVALVALATLSLSIFLWLGRDGAGAGPAGDALAAPLPVTLREPATEPSPDQDAPASDGLAESEPATQPEPGEARPEARRQVEEPEQVAGARLRLSAPTEAVLWVGRGGCLPLDAPAAPAAATLADGFVRRVGGAPGRKWLVDGLSPGPLRILLVADDGGRVAHDDLWLLPGETLDLGELAPRPTATLDLVVRGPDGLALANARVALAGDRPGGAREALGWAAASPLGRTDVSGFLSVNVPIGPWRLLVVGGGATQADDLGLAAFTLEGISLLGDERRAIGVERAHGGEISGDLLDPDELGFAQRQIVAWSPAGPGPAPAQALALGLPLDALATVFASVVTPERRFALRGLPRDTALHLRALVDSDLSHADAFAPTTLARVGERNVEVTQRAGATLELDVIEVGAPASIAEFTAELSGTWPGRPRNGRDGRLVWGGLRPFEAAEDATFGDLPESRDLVLSVSAEGYDVRIAPPLRLRTGEATRVGPLALRKLPFVHVRVVDAVSEAPLEGAECELLAVLPEGAVGRTASRSASDAAGRARLTVPADNLAELVVRRRGYAPLRLRAPAPNLPDQPLRIALAPGASVRARVLDRDGKPLRAEVLRRRTRTETGEAFGESYERALTDAQGYATFRDLEAGAAALAARELPRSDLPHGLPTGSMTWNSVGLQSGGTSEVDLGALAAHAIELELLWQGQRLPGAVVRLDADPAAFRAPYDDARTFLTGPAVRAGPDGRVALGRLHPGVYALRVEHPGVPGFARALLPVGEAGSRVLELASDLLNGEVKLDGERVDKGRVVVWAHGPFYEDGLDLRPGDVARELVPEGIVLGESEVVGGFFAVSVPPGVELVATAVSGRASGDYFVAVPEGRREPISIAVEPSLSLGIAPDLRGKRSRTRELGVVGVNRSFPWGRGLFVQRFDDGELEIDDLPPGRWQLCLVELAGGQLVLEHGVWRQYDLAGGRAGVRLSWRAR